jgi:hypothetical protein
MILPRVWRATMPRATAGHVRNTPRAIQADAGAGDEHHLVLDVEHGFVVPRAMIP